MFQSPFSDFITIDQCGGGARKEIVFLFGFTVSKPQLYIFKMPDETVLSPD